MKILSCIMLLCATAIVGCSKGRTCAIDAECFAGEICFEGTCDLLALHETNNGSTSSTNNTNGSTTGGTNADTHGSTTGTNGSTTGTTNGTTNTTGVTNQTTGPRTFVGLAAGEEYTCALDSAGQMWCWGQNADGRLSVELANNTVDRPQRVVGVDSIDAIAGARNHRCALDDDGTVWCWGRNHGIDAGNPSTTIIAQPMAMPLSDIVRIEMGGYSACALDAGGQLSCWGNTDALPVPAIGEGIVDIAVGDDHTCVALDSGSVRCWGSNYYDALATGDPVQGITGVTAIAAGERHTCAVSGGDVYCWGWNEEGQCGRVPIDFQEKFDMPFQVAGVSNAIDVFAGSTYTCALHDVDRLTCWGGILGYDSTVYQNNLITTPTQLFGLASGVTLVGAGFIHGCAAKSDEIWCWGDNSDRQLGEGGDTFRAEQPVRVEFP